MKSRTRIAWFLLAAGLFCACVKEVRVDQPKAPPNLRAYRGDVRTLWTALMTVITREYGLPMDVADMKRRMFSTKVVYDSGDLVRMRYQLSGNIVNDGTQHIVVLYRQVEMMDNGRWRTQTTDYSLEQAILNRLDARLAGKPFRE